MAESALLSTQPPALPATVARVDPASGRPSRVLLDYELFQRNWFANSVTDIETRIDTVESATNDNTAAITEETNARTSEDAALAEQITTVSARANAATANGQIHFAAVAAPGGAAAAFGVYLTAGNVSTGLQLLAMSDGTSKIALNANQFTLTDSGTATRVFTYSGGVFRFNVPVEVQNQDIAAHAVTNSATASSPGTATAYLSVRDGAQVIIQASISNPSASQRQGLASQGITARDFPVLVDGGEVGRLRSVDGVIAHQNPGSGVYIFFYAIMPAAQSFLVTGLAAGAHSFQLLEPTGTGLTCSITVTELAR